MLIGMKRWNPTNERSTRHIQAPTLHTENQMKELDEGVRYFNFVIILFLLGLRMNWNNIFRSDLAFKCISNAIICACVVVCDVKKKREVDFNYRQRWSEKSKQGRLIQKAENY